MYASAIVLDFPIKRTIGTGRERESAVSGVTHMYGVEPQCVRVRVRARVREGR